MVTTNFLDLLKKMESLVSEKVHFQSALATVDVTTPVSSLWIGMKGALKMRCVVRIESAAGDVEVTLQEATDAAGTGAQNLVRNLPAVYKVDTLASVAVVEDSTALVTVAALNGAAGYVVIEVEGQDLSEGFTHFGLSIDGNAARNASATFEAETEYKPAYEQDL
jgi:hypothetical protein